MWSDKHSAYLMDESHWRVSGVGDLGKFFAAAVRLTAGNGVVCLSDGAWPPKVQELLDRIGVDRDSSPHPGTGCESSRSRHVPLTPGNAASLARVAEQHAEPEIGIHFAVFQGSSVILEWFDAVGEPIAVAGSTAEDAVERFATSAGGRHE